MQKTKLFVTASAVCFALAGAAFSERQSESAALLIPAGKYGIDKVCLAATDVYPPTGCSILGTGNRCLVYVTDSYGHSDWIDGWGSPILLNLCLLELRLPS